MNRIDKKFADLKKRQKKALILFMTAGDPSFRRNEELIYQFEADGIDIIELGVPFSDPLADGPVIQASSKRSLEKHTNLKKILALVKKIRMKSELPILLMSYLNPILSYGLQRFAKEAASAGVDGLVIPDLPYGEDKSIQNFIENKGMALVYLLAPTTLESRARQVGQASSGFVYYVSLTGVTGMRDLSLDGIQAKIKNVKKWVKKPLCVGFGVSTPEQAAKIAKVADGVIIGSYLVRAMAENQALSAVEFSKRFIRPFAKVLGKGV